MFHTGKYNKIPLRKRANKNENTKHVPKLPRHELSNLTSLNDPLFTLPKELLHLSFETTTGKSSSTVKKRSAKRHDKCNL